MFSTTFYGNMFNEISNIVIFVSVYFRYLRYSLHIENPRASTAVIGAFHVAIQFPALGCVPSCGHVEQLGGSAYCPTPPPAGEHLSIKKNIFILRNVELVHRPSPLPDLCDYHADLLNCHVNSTCMGLKRLKGKKILILAWKKVLNTFICIAFMNVFRTIIWFP